MNDPASGLPAQLLPHMHLVSRSRYPVMNALPTETVVDYLISAPKVVRELQPMHWTFLDGPPDGTTLLTWQPLNHLGTNFASDGYVWADAEQAFTFEARGYTVEMWIQRSGYHPPNETIATHSRRRYRLLPPKVPNPNLAPPDPSLWIVHYSRAPQSDHIPANRIPITPPIQAMLAQRRFLQSQGQLVRKEFMLHDRNNWPTISFPPQMGPQGFAQPPNVYPNAIPGRQPQGAFYPPHQGAGVPGGMGPTPTKAPRGHRGSTGAMAAATADFSLEDEEISGDMLDLLSPREISKMRYQQHHEWMEEVFASPYTIKQITPVDLGLGRKGELESLTAGFFEAPVSATPGKDPKDSGVALQAGKMEPDKAEEFADRVAKRVADMTAEIEKLKKRHARRMEKIGRLSVLKEAEMKLRDAAANPSETGSEIWRLEGRIDLPSEEETSTADYTVRTPKYKVDDVVKELENSYGRSIVPEPNISCVEKGGLLERIEPEPAPPAESNDFGSPPTSTPGQGPPSTAAAATAGSAVTTAGQTATSGPGGSSVPQLDGDVEMGGAASNEPTQSNTAHGETGDWVMVDKKDHSTAGAGDKPTVDTPSSGAPGLTPGAATSGLETSNFDDATNYTNMDSAGDALAAYGEQHDLDLPDLENSAFGDAFHASDNEGGHHHPEEDEMS
ncbi:hypothetical protein VTN77DRAFT_4691 [Rasamsonia byssochlamydoides]|uniref:uncharacterized protein n=1 Tax=Rasamsonia byssochlamydoides TaxID=89139 RepID=UPI003743DA33